MYRSQTVLRLRLSDRASPEFTFGEIWGEYATPSSLSRVSVFALTAGTPVNCAVRRGKPEQRLLNGQADRRFRENSVTPVVEGLGPSGDLNVIV